MPADLDQLGRENSHRAVIGWKGLIELGHVTADARPFLNQVHFEPGSGEVKRGLNAADSAPDNHDVSKIALWEIHTHLFTNL
jgi:hypothetical protein